VLQSLMALVSPGDTVIIPAPYWPSYPDMVKLCGAIPLPLQTLPSQNYIIDPKILRSILEANPKTSCIILCNPSNPTGSVFTRQQLQDVAEVLVDFPKVCLLF
jgi:aspartate/methionine/tyrosine aminotransferase